MKLQLKVNSKYIMTNKWIITTLLYLIIHLPAFSQGGNKVVFFTQRISAKEILDTLPPNGYIIFHNLIKRHRNNRRSLDLRVKIYDSSQKLVAEIPAVRDSSTVLALDKNASPSVYRLDSASFVEFLTNNPTDSIVLIPKQPIVRLSPVIQVDENRAAYIMIPNIKDLKDLSIPEPSVDTTVTPNVFFYFFKEFPKSGSKSTLNPSPPRNAFRSVN